jgi:alkaline phosphatase D
VSGPSKLGLASSLREPRLPPDWRQPSDPAATERPRFSTYPFSLGVASGSPTSTGVVLWTRLAPEPLAGGGMTEEAVSVAWEVAEDEAFGRVVERGTIDALTGRAHSVHVEVERLQPDREYWYRFIAGDDASPVGRTRTAPAADARPDRLRFGLASCQQFEQGYFSAYRHLLAEDVDLMVHVGDYIYESSWGANLVRRHSAGEPRTLLDYRDRHAQYKTDPDLQRMHAAVPWLVTWDDHEVDNDYADNRAEDLDPDFLRRRAAAYQAYFEHMPLREAARPRGPDMRLHQRCDWGALARLHILDGRQYRTWQACPRPGRGGSNNVDASCTARLGGNRTILGTEQERWLEQGLREAAGRWNVLAEATLMAQAATPVSGGGERFWTDAWDGYPAARDRLLRFLDSNGVRSCVMVSGDAHTNFVADLKLDFDDPGSRTVAAEVCGTSITSQGRAQTATDAIRAHNPHIHLADSSRRGYVVLDLDAERCRASLRVLDTVKVRESQVSTLAEAEILAGRPGANLL